MTRDLTRQRMTLLASGLCVCLHAGSGVMDAQSRQPSDSAPGPLVRVLEPLGFSTPTPEAAAATSDRGAVNSLPAAVAGGDVLGVVRKWALAWQDQRADDYLGYYSSHFKTPDGMSFTAWAAQRRERVLKPLFIAVAVISLEEVYHDAGLSAVRYTQIYRSDTYGDTVVKVLKLAWEQGAWKIVEEGIEE